MQARGRKSIAYLATPRVDGKPSPLDPPSFLKPAARAIFNELVGSVDSRHFTKSDLPLLVSLAQVTLLTRQTAGNAKRFQQWEKAVRLQTSLCTRLRMTPQSRLDPKTVSRRVPYEGPVPWLMKEMDE